MPVIVGVLGFALSFLAVSPSTALPPVEDGSSYGDSSYDDSSYDDSSRSGSYYGESRPVYVEPPTAEPPALADPGLAVLLIAALLSGVTAALGNRWRWPLFAVAAIGWWSLGVWSTAVAASYYAATR